MYCKRCGQQLSDNAVFCGNCGTPIVRNQHIMSEISGSAGKGAKKNGKKVWGILILCLFFLLGGSVGGIFVYRLNQDKPEAMTASGRSRQDLTGEGKNGLEIEKISEAEEMPEAEEIVSEPAHCEDDNGTNSTYELIVADVTWTEAYQDCLKRGGHLVSINSDEEYQEILRQIADEDMGNIKFWLGGRRDGADSQEYRWINEDGTYERVILNQEEPYVSYWLTGEPSFYDGSASQDEMYMNMFYVSKEKRWVWNDVPDDLIAIAEYYSGTVGYICEYEN